MFYNAGSLANMTQSVTEESCSKNLFGKTHRKNVALPSILHQTKTMEMTETEIGKL